MPRKKHEGIYSRAATAFIIVFEDETELRAFFMKKGSPISLSVPFFFFEEAAAARWKWKYCAFISCEG